MGKLVLVLGTAARGGIRSVIEAYEAAGFYRSGHARFVPTHLEGSLTTRLLVALRAYGIVAWALLCGRVDVLHMHMSMRGSFWRKFIFLHMGRLARVPVIVHLHGSEFGLFYQGSPGWVRAAVRRLFDQASAVVVLSESWREFVRGLTHNTVHVIGNFVPDQFDAARAARDRQPRHVLFLGQFGDRKGIYDLLPVFVEVARRFPDARLVCGGNGEIDRVREMVAALAATNFIEVPGWVSGEDKTALLHRCSVFVLPSYNEGLPMAIIEAMSYGMAVVSTRVGGIPELVDEGNGALVTPGNREALTQALIAVLEGDRAVELGVESRRRYETGFSPQAGMARMRSLYQALGVKP